MSGPEILEHREAEHSVKMCIYKNSEFTTENHTKEPNAELKVTGERGDQREGWTEAMNWDDDENNARDTGEKDMN